MGGMSHFYKSLLEQNEEVHSAAVAATQTRTVEPSSSSSAGLSLTIAKPPALQGPAVGPANDLDLARLARDQGKDVELNDDNQIVDKRDLLSAGLNLSLPNTRHLALSAAKQKNDGKDDSVQTHTAVGTAATRQEINARRQREVDRQWQEERDRARKERERLEEEEREKLVKRRNDDDAVTSARERFLARKRRKLEDGSATGAGTDVVATSDTMAS
ncbi:hypothetical protein BKA62DRAFT_29783 [Auriculariales sp. MPI-PUGE-AT-0066]|nr:hypothetical protein BKA62DRAFT_29783 [Auriculariales sp. MPI-PUGE-AT-0066]